MKYVFCFLLLPFIVLGQKPSISEGQSTKIGVISDSISFTRNTVTYDIIEFVEQGRNGVFRKTNQSISHDGVIYFIDALGQKWARDIIDNTVNPEWWGAIFGDIKLIQSNYRIASQYRMRNMYAFKKAADFAIQNKMKVFVSGYLEVWTLSGSAITITDGKTLSIFGTSKVSSLVKVFPNQYEGPGKYSMFTVDLGGSVDFKDVSFNGRLYENSFQTYSAISAPSGVNNRFNIPDSVSLWSGFWSDLKVGDTLFYCKKNNLGFFSTINAIDSVLKNITISSTINASVTSGTIVMIGVYWPSKEISQSVINSFSKKWQKKAAVFG